jgi:hypothetical protein
MSDVQLSVAETKMKQANVPFATPELDEGLWRAWKEKNRVKDRIRAAHRRRVLMVLIAIAVVALIVAYSAGAIA